MMLLIIIVALVLIFLATTFIKLEHDLKTVKAIVLVVLLLVVAGSVYGWIRSDSSDFSSPGGIVSSVYSYIIWLGNAGVAIWDTAKYGAGTVGNVINSNPNTTKVQDLKYDGRK